MVGSSAISGLLRETSELPVLPQERGINERLGDYPLIDDPQEIAGPKPVCRY
jgi:hypothetical protein